MNDWKETLGALMDSESLPAGEALEVEAEKAGSRQDEASALRKNKLPKVNYFYEKKGRSGKPATILTGFAPALTDDEISDIARTLKQRMGCGGSARGGEILLQGDRRQQAREILQKMGFK